MFGLSYCINLDNRKDRWEQVQEEFKKIDFYPTRFSAIENENKPRGCLQSHLAILKEARDKDQNVLIFEDDVELRIDAIEIIESALDELSEIDWTLFYLGGNILKPFHQYSNHLAKLNHCQSTHAYSANKKYLTPIIDFLEKNDFFIDVLYAEGIVPYTNSYITVPMVAIQRASFSDIENKIMTYDIPIERYNRYFIPLTKS